MKDNKLETLADILAEDEKRKPAFATFELIGCLAFDWYKADIERFNARKQRAIARNSHLCTNERDIGDGHVEPYPCWQYAMQPASISSHLPDWCDNCKFVQPYYLSYLEAAKKARVARFKLTRALKNILQNDGS